MLRRKMRRWVVAGLAGFTMLAGPVGAESLNTVLAKAYSNSGLLEQNQALLNAADEDVFRAMSALQPIVSWSAGASQTWSNNAGGASDALNASLGLSASMPVYDFGRGQLGVDLAEEAVQGTRQRLIGIEQNVLLSAVQAYMQYRQAAELVALRENNLRVIERELQAANDRFEVGEITRTDVALAQAAQARSSSSLAQARGDLLNARENFVAAVGVAPQSPSAPGALPDLPDTVAIAKAIAGRGHPDLISAQSSVKQAEIQVAQAEAEMMPNVSLTGRISLSEELGGSSFNNSSSIGINAEMPLMSGGRLDAGVRQARAREASAKAALRVTLLNLESQVGVAYARLSVAEANRRATEQQIEAAQIAFDGVREEANLGARTTLDVLNAEQDLLDARANLVIANTEVVVATYSALAAIGQLTSEKLGLKVERFDPEAYTAAVKAAPASERGLQLDRVLGAIGK